MKAIYLLVTLIVFIPTSAQIPTTTLVRIVKAEDARAYDKSLEALISATNPAVQMRAALAVGRIGNDAAVPALVALLENEQSEQLRTIAVFAIGEIESIKAADAILKALRAETRVLMSVPNLTARLVEAAGKIAAANPKDEKAKALGQAILDTLNAEAQRSAKQNREVILLGLTAALRAKPDGTDLVVAKFLTSLDPRIRADAANTLTRIRAKNANAALRAMLLSDEDPIVRANAARALGAAEDKEAFNLLLAAVTEDDDSRVRVSAIRALGSLKDAKAADKLLERGEKLLTNYKKSRFANPVEKNELLEVATALGRLLPNSNDKRTIKFLIDLRQADRYHSPETEIAFARVSPKEFLDHSGVNAVIRSTKLKKTYADWRLVSSIRQGQGELGDLDPKGEYAGTRRTSEILLRFFLADPFGLYTDVEPDSVYKSTPDVLRAYANFKSDDLNLLLKRYLKNQDIFVRATAAELLANQPVSRENVEALKKAFNYALVKDMDYNDAQLAILDALYKLDKREAIPTIWTAINSTDHLVRKKAFDLLKEMQKDPALANVAVEGTLNPKKLQLSPYVSGSKLGQIINTQADYKRASLRKNGSVKAVLTTEKGTFTIDFFPEDAPLTVDNFIKLARSNYFNGLEVHRVVPNFVMQDGDPRGDGNGGPGWSIRCEVNMLPYGRGAVGMALSGKDTGGSQWFVTHSPQPHLDGGYTVFGRVNETDMKVVDNIVRGDKIISVRITDGNLWSKTQKARR